MAGAHPWKTWATWQVTGNPGADSGSVTPASLEASSLSNTAGFPLRLLSHCHVLKTITFFPSFQPQLFAYLLYILSVFLVGGIQGFL